MKFKRENHLQKIVTLRVQKKMMRKRVKKKSENKKESEKKIDSGKNERKIKKQGSFYAKASDVKNVILYKPVYICTLVQRGMF